MNVSSRGGIYNQFNGTIVTGGTISNTIDLGDASNVAGMIFPGSVVYGSLTFQVSHLIGGPFVTVMDTDGTDFDLGPRSGGFAISSDDMSFLMPFRYLRVKTSVAQTNGLVFYVTTRS